VKSGFKVSPAAAAGELSVRPLINARQKTVAACVLALLFAVVAIWLLRSPSSSPVTVSFRWFANDPREGPCAVLGITNISATPFLWEIETFAFTNGAWQRAARQPKVERSTAHVGGHDWSSCNLPLSEGDNRWKVEVRYRRYDTRLENTIEGVLRFFHLKNSSAESRPAWKSTEVEFER
jgi:hypothetical protein